MLLEVLTTTALKFTERTNMFDYYNSSKFMNQVLKRMEQTIDTSSVSKTVFKFKKPCINIQRPKSEKLVLKFTRSNFFNKVIDFRNEKEKSKSYERQCKWKVFKPADFQNGKLVENNDNNYNLVQQNIVDEDLIINLDDLFNPSLLESREKMRRLKKK